MYPLTKQWLKYAAYDLTTAEAMLKTGRYLYVAFMCQQAIEKLLKGIIQERQNKTPPYSHRLTALLKDTGLSMDPSQLDFLDLLTSYYINARYPEYKQKLAKALNKEKVTVFLKQTKECFRCLKKELKS